MSESARELPVFRVTRLLGEHLVLVHVDAPVLAFLHDDRGAVGGRVLADLALGSSERPIPVEVDGRQSRLDLDIRVAVDLQVALFYLLLDTAGLLVGAKLHEAVVGGEAVLVGEVVCVRVALLWEVPLHEGLHRIDSLGVRRRVWEAYEGQAPKGWIVRVSALKR